MGKITIQKTHIDGLVIIKPTVIGDDRGAFMEVYNKKDLEEVGIQDKFVQENWSKSAKGVLRGIHYQKNYSQSKLVRVIKGEIYDVAVDLRKNSATYGKYYGVILNETNKLQFYIPKGFGHGMLVLEEGTEIEYKCDEFYHPEEEAGIMWNDKDINIAWPLEKVGGAGKVILSNKDKMWKNLKEEG